MIDTKKGTVEVNGTQLNYEEAGSGFPLVLVHAGIADLRMWDDQFAAFAGHFRTIRYDMRGFGQSPRGKGPFAHRDDLHALLGKLGVEKASLIGCSMGGRTVTGFALEHPEMAAGLVLVSSGVEGLAPEGEPPAIWRDIEAAEKKHDMERVNELEVHLWFDGLKRKPEKMDPAKRQLVLDMNRIALKTPSDQAREKPVEPPPLQRLDELKLPVLVIYGDLDVSYMADAAAVLGANLPNSRTVVLSKTAHLPNMERPEDFNKVVLGFLEGIR